MENFIYGERLALAGEYEEYKKLVQKNYNTPQLQATVHHHKLVVSAIEKAMRVCGYKYSTTYRCFIEIE